MSEPSDYELLLQMADDEDQEAEEKRIRSDKLLQDGYAGQAARASRDAIYHDSRAVAIRRAAQLVKEADGE